MAARLRGPGGRILGLRARQHPDDYHDLFGTLIRATEVEIDNHYKGWEITEDEPISLQIYYPLLVLRGELFTASDADDAIALEEADHVQFNLEHFSTTHRASGDLQSRCRYRALFT